MADPIVAQIDAPVEVDPVGTPANPAPESKETGDAAQPEGTASKVEAKKVAEVEKQLKKLKIKYNGREEDVEFDPSDDEYLTRQFQLAKLGQSKAQDYATLEKEVHTFIEELRKNPKKILADKSIGIDIKKFAAEILEEEIANSKKSPEQLDKERLEGELKAAKEQLEKDKEEFRQKEFERIQEQEFARYDTLMSQALDKSDLPKSPYVVKKMADYMLLALQKNIDVSPEDVLPVVRDEMQNDLKEMFKIMPDEVIEALVGKDVIGRIRKKSVAKAKEAIAPPINKALAKAAEGKKDKADGKKMSFKDFFGT